MLEDEPLDRIIKRHLADELDPQIGRAASRFEADSVRRSGHTSLWPRKVAWISTAAAACLMFAWGWQSLHHSAQSRRLPVAPIEVGPSNQSAELIPVTESIAWRTIDDGVVSVEDDVPIRQLRSQVLQYIEWYDPQRKATVEMTVPREQIIYVALNSH